ncbi:homeobox protein Hox-B2a-like [Solea senegalensis]|uniref:Homeobox protein Hox-B2a-like n=1 Tax=Solea senegalensis TaxID=28829 RepID=A0AAV6RGV2_SOLSE|nr:homeobox protein Hox-B2a-like [Solea senegalensis]
MNFEFEREIGFINSQPSLAECLTSFPAALESFQTSSIKESTVIPPPFEHTIPSLSPCTASQPRPAARSQQNRRSSATNGLQTHHRGAQQPGPLGQAPAPVTATPAGPMAHEFPWMKEKKSSKKCPKPGGSSSSGGSIIPPASSSPSPTASGPESGGSGCWRSRRQTHHKDGGGGGSGGGHESSDPGGFEPLEGADASSPYSSQPLEASGTGEATLEGERVSGDPSSAAAYASDSGDNAQPTPEEGGRLSRPELPQLPAESGTSDVAASPHSFPNTNSADNPGLVEAGPAAATAVADSSFSEQRDISITSSASSAAAPAAPAAASSSSSSSSALPDLTFFAGDACLSPSLQSSLDSPVDFSEEDFDLFTSTLCTIDLQHLNF